MSGNIATKVAIVVLLAAAVATVVVAKRQRAAPERVAGPAGGAAASAAGAATCCAVGSAADPVVAATTQPVRAAIARLVDLGAGKCIPCKKMAPVLEDLKTSLAGRLEVQFIDVGLNPGASTLYGIKVIPTQIFYDAAGNELSRHEGFMAGEDILARFRHHGIELARSN